VALIWCSGHSRVLYLQGGGGKAVAARSRSAAGRESHLRGRVEWGACSLVPRNVKPAKAEPFSTAELAVRARMDSSTG
jgi:hypothetical protein